MTKNGKIVIVALHEGSASWVRVRVEDRKGVFVRCIPQSLHRLIEIPRLFPKAVK